MTVLSRGARVRRGGRRPGWALLTALLVLAIGASSALVFTDRVELLKLAVILALWAVVVAAFVSVIYRRQSDVAQARARDMKLIYDLQLDREISARREYELGVESQLRRELASELRAESADEIAALRSELSALRTNLEILFGADLEHRPALEHDRSTVHAISDRAAGTGGSAEWAASSRIDAELADDSASQTTENPIIDVREVGVPAAAEQPVQPARPAAELFGSARHAGEGGRRSRRRRAEAEQPQPAHRHEATTAQYRPIDREPLPPPQPQPWQPAARQPAAPQPPPAAPQPAAPQPPPAAWYPPPAEPGWQPVGTEGQWLPPETPGSHWTGPVEEPPPPPVPEPRVGRHYGPPEPQPGYAPPMPTRPEPVARHRGAAEPEEPEQSTGRRSRGQSVADLLARFQVDPTTGGGRRRRRTED